MTLSQDSAELIGLNALTWLVGHSELCPIFLGSTGASEADVKARAADPTFQASVLEFIMMDDAWVMQFCDAFTLDYQLPMQAHAVLSGGGDVHWT